MCGKHNHLDECLDNAQKKYLLKKKKTITSNQHIQCTCGFQCDTNVYVIAEQMLCVTFEIVFIHRCVSGTKLLFV